MKMIGMNLSTMSRQTLTWTMDRPVPAEDMLWVACHMAYGTVLACTVDHVRSNAHAGHWRTLRCVEMRHDRQQQICRLACMLLCMAE